MANSPAQCRQIIDAAHEANRKLMVAYRCRYEPYNQEAIRIAQSPDLGPLKVILADAGFPMGDSHQWRLNKNRIDDGYRHLCTQRGWKWRR
jgi:predicted dehydrogenase